MGIVVRTAKESSSETKFWADGVAAPLFDDQFIMPVTGPLASQTNVSGGSSLNNAAAGLKRIVGWGMELKNVSSALLRQGTLAVCKVPFNDVPVLLVNSTPSPDRFVWAHRVRAPPNLSAMVINPTYDEWEAKEGAYVVYTMAGDDLQVKDLSNQTIALTGADPQGSANPVYGVELATDKNGTSADHGLGQYNPLTQVFEWNYHPIQLLGQGRQSVYSIETHVYLEQFPSSSEAQLLTMARPTSRWNPRVYSVIDKMLNDKPAAVRVDENPLGEWFWSCIDNLATYGDDLGTVASASGTPGGTFVGAGLKMGAKAALLAQGGRKLYAAFNKRRGR